MYTKIKLTSRTQTEMARMVMPYFGAGDLKPLMKEFSALLSLKHRRKVEAVHVPTPNHGPDHIRVGIVVEGELDQGVFFDKPLPPLRARPVKNPRSEKEFFEDINKRFSKTLEYLSEN